MFSRNSSEDERNCRDFQSCSLVRVRVGG